MGKYQTVIGLEIHAQLNSRSKIFCPEAVDFGGEPNTRISPISLGHPGTLPSVNQDCIKMAVKIGLATGCTIAEECHFARKNYFYPDLPKGYQISQDDTPICTNGTINIRLKDGSQKKIRIQRIHIEEDSGKSYHDQDLYDSLVDFNRAGVGLIEIVSMPDIETPEEAMAYLTEVRKLVRYLDICDGNMEEGSLRCDANVSIMPVGSTVFGTRTEVKNINSISNVGKAIAYEAIRQEQVLESGGKVFQETRTFDASTGTTFGLRDKETSADYRYFPEPDLLPVVLSTQDIADIQASLPELPEALFEKYTQAFGLPEHDATLLTEQKQFAQYFEEVLKSCSNKKAVSNWMNGSVKGYLNEMAIDITEFPIIPQTLAELINLVNDGKVSLTVAKDQLFQELLKRTDVTPLALATELNVILDSNSDEISAWIDQAIAENQPQVQQYLGGKTGIAGFLVGKVVKLSQGKADPKVINQMMVEKLDAMKS